MIDTSKKPNYLFVLGSTIPHLDPPYYFENLAAELFSRNVIDVVYLTVPTKTVNFVKRYTFNFKNILDIFKRQFCIYWNSSIYKIEAFSVLSKLITLFSFFELYLFLHFRKYIKKETLVYLTNFPENDSICQWIPADIRIYDCMDIFNPNLFAQNSDQIRQYDFVLNHSEILQSRLSAINKRTYFVSSGHVKKLSFIKNSNRLHNSVVFSGGISRRIDFELLNNIIAACKNYDFYFIGEVYLGKYYIEKEDDFYRKKWNCILKRKNAHYLGSVHPDKVTQVLSMFEYGLIPYKDTDSPNEYANSYTPPMKLFDYVSANLPVLTTNLQAVMSYSNEIQVFSYQTVSDFKSLLRALSKSNSLGKRNRHEEILLKNNTMEKKVDQILNLLKNVH